MAPNPDTSQLRDRVRRGGSELLFWAVGCFGLLARRG